MLRTYHIILYNMPVGNNRSRKLRQSSTTFFFWYFSSYRFKFYMLFRCSYARSFFVFGIYLILYILLSVPYSALVYILQQIELETKRLKIIDLLANFFRSVLVLSPKELLSCVYLCCNKVGYIATHHEFSVWLCVWQQLFTTLYHRYSIGSFSFSR